MTPSLARRLPFFYGWLVVAVVFVTMALGVNARTAFSLLMPPVLAEFGWDRGVTAGAFSFGFLVSAVLSPTLGRLMDARGPRTVMLLGVSVTGAGLLLDRAISAAEARDWGLVTELVPADALLPSALGIACRIAASPPPTVRNAKRMLQGDVAEVEAALEAERRGFIEAIGSLDARERILRLLEDAPHYPGDTHGPGG